MRARGQFIGKESREYTNKRDESVAVVVVKVLTTEDELVLIEAQGTYTDTLRAAVANMKSGDSCDFGVSDPREFGGKVSWRFVAEPVKGGR